jgi:lysophospholipase L1-like esterase
VTGLLYVRDGIPRFARLVRDGKPATIVAYGTSMTRFGGYLARLPAVLDGRSGNARIRLVNRGFRGFFTFAGAFRVADAVLPEAPDLVLLEFAHNDAEADALATIGPALDGIIAQVRAAFPACEFAFVYLAAPGAAVAGPTPAMRAHEAAARYYGFPSFDLATLSEALVSAGVAGWTAGELPALTRDGVHHSDEAADLIGIPFAAAFAELLEASHGSPAPAAPRPVRDLSLARTARVPVAALTKAGPWATGRPPNHDTRNCDAYDEEAAEPLVVQSAFRLRFEGTQVFLWAMGDGVLEVAVSGIAERFELEVRSGSEWSFHTISPRLAPGAHQLDAVALRLPLVLGDLFIVGGVSAGTEAPGVVK